VYEYLIPPFDIPTMSDAGFDFGTRIGPMLFMVEAFAASALAVTGLLLYTSVRFRSPSVNSVHIDIPITSFTV